MLKDNKLLKEYQLRRVSFERDEKKVESYSVPLGVLLLTLFVLFVFMILSFQNPIPKNLVHRTCGPCPLAQVRLASIDELENAQKDINKKLGIPPSEHEGTEKPGNPVERNPTNPLVSWALVAIATMGIGILLLILRKERKKIRHFEDNPLGILSKDREPLSFDAGKQTATLPELQRPVTELSNAPIPAFPEATKTLEEETTVLTGKLDRFLNGMREQTGPRKEQFDLSVQRFDPKLKSFFHVGQVTGKRFPANHVLGFLNADMANAWIDIHFTEWEKSPKASEGGTGPIIFSIGFPFFDNKGQLYALTISCADCPELPSSWYEGFKEFIPDIQKILLDYPNLRYALPTETRNIEGDLDLRAVENRVFLEIQKGTRLGITFTLLFIKLASPGKENTSLFLNNEFFPRFKRWTEDTLRQGDSLTVLPENVILILFPETNQAEANYVLERINERFESLLREYKTQPVKLFSNFIEWRKGSPISPQILLKNGLRFDIPQEKSEEQQLLEHLRGKKFHSPGPDPNTL